MISFKNTNKKIDKSFMNLDNIDILFYSEGGQYWNVYKPIIDELEKREIKSAYYTSKKNDPALSTNYKYLRKKYIGQDNTTFQILNNIKVKLFITTTPQLDVMHLKKSKNVEEYIHLIHAPTDCLMYKYFAFDFFDTVMCSGKHQIESIREIEDKRKTKKKMLLKTGLTYFDVLKKKRVELEKKIKKNIKKTILVAPTWKDNNLLEINGTKLLKDLVASDYEVILRPHPQMYISKQQIIKNIEKEIEDVSNLKIDNSPSAEETMVKADILITDLSGIIFDFYFVFEKPVISIDGLISKSGQEAECVSKNPWEIENLKNVSTVLNFESMNNIQKYIDTAYKITTKENIEEFRKVSVFNYGNAGKVAAEQIIEKIKN